MSLAQQLTQDMKTALKSGDKERLSVIRMVLASIKKSEIDNRGPLNDEGTLEVVLREVKQRQDSISEYEKADRQDLADKERFELGVLHAYLPKQLSEEEVRAIVLETIQAVGASSKADMGKAMGAILPKVKGKTDGKLVSKLVQEALS
ncbi:hypothetical protein SAMN04487866_11640 [Thermoactinomyces sp. DSM 45891]|uniref:GatB/YqeY domain-containing protein n=1 Tax=Thermoactinomyces sp. DSM 45891 TaxID=1761907 RepID=UPI000914CA9D|nr:GatB/YqeY domain-containing protein [Thermoactinomyces sp. DSM 45891]SFX66442.1 hypothetical protein SAMN04487866_11640 [Thermoactinomyces sp. DSM 45891]